MKIGRKILAFMMVAALMLSLSAIGVLAADTASAAPAQGGEGGGMGFGSTASTGVSSAEDLTDYTSVSNKDAVALLVSLGIINGIKQDDGKYAYEPSATITREAMAKMVAVAVTLYSGADIAGTTGQFTDVDGRWSEDYVNFCADQSIINGRGNGIFDYEGSITVRETAKLLLAAMGVSGLTGDAWKTLTEAAAEEKGILEGVKGGLDEAVTRDEAALIIYNALTKSDGSAVLPKVVVMNEDTRAETYDIAANMLIAPPAGKLVTMLSGGKEVDTKVPGTYTDVQFVLTDKWDHNPGSYSGRGIENYRAALVVSGDKVDEARSVTEAISAGTYDAVSASDLIIDGASDSFGGIILENTAYTIKNAKITLNSDSDGSDVSDFTGLGAAIAAFGAKVTIESSDIETTGVAKLTAFSDQTSDILVKASTLKAMGGKLYDGYVNSADQTKMVSPP